MASAGNGRRLDPLVRDRLQEYFPGFDLDAVRLHDGLPRHVPAWARGYVSGERIYLAAGLPRDGDGEALALLAHELVHVRQYRELGAWPFRLAYVREYLTGRLRLLGHDAAYRNISFEREARAMEARVRRDLGTGSVRT